jgi:hypothetical protein
MLSADIGFARAPTAGASIQNNSGLPPGPADPSIGRLVMRANCLGTTVPGWYDWWRTGGRKPMFDMRRREFITLLGGAVAWPLGAHVQVSTKRPLIGVMVAGDTTR